MTGVLASVAALGEALSPTLLSGLALIVGGMALVNLPEARARRPR